MYDVITIGSNTVDVFARTKFSELIKIMKPGGETDLLAYPTGSKILIEELNFSTGGGGTNTAVCLSRLGHKVAYLGKIGNDENGSIIIKDLKKENVGLLVAKGNGNSGYSVILDSLEHDRTILTCKGQNDHLSYREIPLKKLKTRWFYFSSMMGESFRSVEKLSLFAKKNGIKVIFNASSYLAEKGLEYLKTVLSNTEILVLNEDEASTLVGKAKVDEMLKKLLSLGPRIAVITLGKKGSAACDGKSVYYINPADVKVIETTGAGDAFASTFLSGIIRKNNIEYAARLATLNAGSVISHPGAKNKLLTRQEAARLMKSSNIKIVKRRTWPIL